VEETAEEIDLRARVGVNAGRVISREGDYFGRTVNVAARIADFARPGEILVSAEVKERAGTEGVDFQPLGPALLKGLKDEVTLYSAVRAGS
jgi:adenylate cyclase